MHERSPNGRDKNNHALAAFRIRPVPRTSISSRMASSPALALPSRAFLVLVLLALAVPAFVPTVAAPNVDNNPPDVERNVAVFTAIVAEPDGVDDAVIRGGGCREWLSHGGFVLWLFRALSIGLMLL